MSNKLTAPKVDCYVDMLRDFKYRHVGYVYTYDDRTYELLDELFSLIGRIKPVYKNGARELWLWAERGPIEDFGDYQEMLEYEEVTDYTDYQKQWKDYYPNEVKWYYFGAVDDKEINYQSVFMKHRQIIEYDKRQTEKSFPYDISELAEWMLESVKEVIKMLEEGTYNDFVEKNLPYELRTGTIVRKKYWDIYPDLREEFFKNLTREEVDEFVKFVAEQPDDAEMFANKLPKMTANDFYCFCSMGYKANNYSGCDLPLRKQYERYADGRDDGLSEINPDSPKEFYEWLNDRKRFGGHPFEVCRGGNSTHIDLYVCSHKDGYTLSVAGSSLCRCVETVKFYLALKRLGLPVYIDDGKVISNRLLEQEKIGIVPNGVTPVYCDSYFPNEKIIAYMNLPYDEPEKVINASEWYPLDEVKLLTDVKGEKKYE